ncbi:hypothetical protein FN846DRAFT_209191 [Sphaerosporella brunnea]|uniref:Pentacotripeptide-repeat region of PRORP domain-containing protein n=1 Tax=Sphaerosporella brunnea TaxID=1250544 RepID=A0A5J5EQC0_9PEZI|nr:hypothetical protein FN846DRAFT_209191 [Sphaerosporella brunnea]
MRPRSVRQLSRPPFLRELLHSRCAYRLLPALFLSLPHQLHQQRNISVPRFLARNSTPTRPESPPGFDIFDALVRHLDKKIGPAPSPEAVAYAMAQFVRYCNSQPMRGYQAKRLRRGYEYLRAQGTRVGTSTLSSALEVLKGGGEEQLKLARLLWKDLLETNGYKLNKKDLLRYITTLCASKCVDEAVELSRQHVDVAGGGPWIQVMSAFTKQGNEEGLLEAVEFLRARPEGMAGWLYFYPVDFYCHCDKLKNALTWFERAMEDGKENVPAVYVVILEACLRTGQLEFGSGPAQKIVKDGHEEMKKEDWEVVLRFVAAQGGSMEEQQRILDRMQSEPDLKTINNLISAAVTQRNHGAVDHYLAQLAQLGLQPDHSTLELKLRSFIYRNDLTAAWSVYEDLKYTQEIPAGYTGLTPQDLLRAMVKDYPNCDLTKAAAIYQDLAELKIRLTPRTLLPLVDAYLQEEAFENVKDLLNKHVGHFSPEERKSVIELLVVHGQRDTTSVEALWNTYMSLIRSFPETSITKREIFMNLFFEQNRPFAAVRILEHMGMTDDRKPTKYQYTAAFVGIGNARNLQCLEKAYRMLNMDPFVEVDTVLRNALMFAFAHCGLFERAFEVYEQIARSQEGPNHATISQVFDICSRITYGLLRAKKLWAGYRRMGIELTANNVASYVEAISKHGAWDDAWDVVKNMEQDLGFPPDEKVYVTPLSCVMRRLIGVGVFRLSTLFSMFKRNRLPELEEWLEKTYPETWDKIMERVNAQMVAEEARSRTYVNLNTGEITKAPRVMNGEEDIDPMR